MMKPKRRPVKRENLALKQINQMLKNVSDKEMRATIKEELDKLGPIDDSVDIPKKKSKEDESKFLNRLLLRLRRIRPGQEKYKAAEKKYVTGLPEMFKTKKINRRYGLGKKAWTTFTNIKRYSQSTFFKRS